MTKVSKLEEVAIAARKQLLTNNTFNDFDNNNNYSATHTNAKADETTPVHGKGTGVYLDTANGGSSHDINGVASAAGSGRIQNILVNQYSEGKEYEHPDTTGNLGQVTI